MKPSPHVQLWRRPSRWSVLRPWCQAVIAAADMLARFAFVVGVALLALGGIFLLVLAAGVTFAVGAAGRRHRAA